MTHLHRSVLIAEKSVKQIGLMLALVRSSVGRTIVTIVVLARAVKAEVCKETNTAQFFDERGELEALYKLDEIKGFYKNDVKIEGRPFHCN